MKREVTQKTTMTPEQLSRIVSLACQLCQASDIIVPNSTWSTREEIDHWRTTHTDLKLILGKVGLIRNQESLEGEEDDF